MNSLRRTFLKSTGAASAFAVLLVSGLARPMQAFAAEWNKAAFGAKTLADALKGIGVDAAADSREIQLIVPDIAENGAVVPVEVTSKIPGTQTISILVEKNPQPLSASFDFTNGAEPYVSTRIKMGQTSNIKIIVNAGGKFYATSKEVKVTIGGCGG